MIPKFKNKPACEGTDNGFTRKYEWQKIEGPKELQAALTSQEELL